MSLGQGGPRGRDPAPRLARARRRLRVQDEHGDVGHRRSLLRRRAILARRVRTYIGLGANLGDAAATVAGGIRALAAMPSVRLRSVSRLYATEPVGVVDQPEFRNAVVALDVPRGPDPATGALALLIALKRIEHAFGRQERERWGPRELDLDLLVFGRHEIAVERPPDARSADAAKPPDLFVPHRLAGERLFVLAPFADLAQRLRPPGPAPTGQSPRPPRGAAPGPGPRGPPPPAG